MLSRKHNSPTNTRPATVEVFPRGESLAEDWVTTAEMMKAEMSHGNIEAAHAAWLQIMNKAGQCYLYKTKELDPPDTDQAANAIIGALVTISALLPDDEANQPAKLIFNALIDLVVKAPTGKRDHPLFEGHGLPGTRYKGSLRQQSVVGIALACVRLLKELGHPSPDKFVAKAISDAGYEVTRSTVSSWKRRIASWPIAISIRDAEIENAKADGLIDESASLSSVERTMREKMKRAVATCL